MANYADMHRSSELHGWHLYILEEDGGAFSKIGTALTVKYRTDGIRNGNPRPLHLRYAWHIPSRADALRIESLALQEAGSTRVGRRDWVEMSAVAAAALVGLVLASTGIIAREVQV